MLDFRREWREIILKNLIYPNDSFFVDFPQEKERLNVNRVFMFANFVKPGKHRTFVYDPKNEAWYKREFFVDIREKSLPEFAKLDLGTAEKPVILNSVFKEWVKDTETTYDKCYNVD